MNRRKEDKHRPQVRKHRDRDYGLGRKHAKDERDLLVWRSPMRVEHTERMQRFWTMPPLKQRMYQNGFPRCVTYCGGNFVMSGGLYRPFTADLANQFYFEAQKVDEWDGEDYDGTSVRAGCKVFKEHGYIGDYYFAFDMQSVIYQLLERGCMWFGTTWKAGMFDIDSKRFIRATGSDAGGHSYLGTGIDLDPPSDIGEPYIRILNQWHDFSDDRPDWGYNGHARISLDDFATLLEDDGEAAIAEKVAA